MTQVTNGSEGQRYKIRPLVFATLGLLLVVGACAGAYRTISSLPSGFPPFSNNHTLTIMFTEEIISDIELRAEFVSLDSVTFALSFDVERFSGESFVWGPNGGLELSNGFLLEPASSLQHDLDWSLTIAGRDYSSFAACVQTGSGLRCNFSGAFNEARDGSPVGRRVTFSVTVPHHWEQFDSINWGLSSSVYIGGVYTPDSGTAKLEPSDVFPLTISSSSPTVMMFRGLYMGPLRDYSGDDDQNFQSKMFAIQLYATDESMRLWQTVLMFIFPILISVGLTLIFIPISRALDNK